LNRSQTWSRTAAPGEIIYSEGFAGERLIFVIADGKVEISTRCDDKKVVMATLGRGEFFGETALLGAEPRPNTAKALSFCQLTVVPASLIERTRIDTTFEKALHGRVNRRFAEPALVQRQEAERRYVAFIERKGVA